jgi:hypothetical protein
VPAESSSLKSLLDAMLDRGDRDLDDGTHVFFETAEQFLPADTDTSRAALIAGGVEIGTLRSRSSS